ncbi:MAG: PAS domain-containing protein [Acidobacteriota bacterium]
MVSHRSAGASASGPGGGALPRSIIRSRWTLVVTAGYLVVFGTPDRMPPWPQLLFVAAMLLSNSIIARLGARAERWPQLLEVVTVLDVLAVTMVIGFVDPSIELYLATFAGLILGTALGRVGITGSLMLLVCASYGAFLYNAIGGGLWRSQELLLRMPFLFGVALYFGSVGQHLQSERARTLRLKLMARQNAQRTTLLEREQDRLRALSEIGRLGLTGAGADPAGVLLGMSERVRKVLAVDRCSLSLFDLTGQRKNMITATKDKRSEVRVLEWNPEHLLTILDAGKITELHPKESIVQKGRVNELLPGSESFGSILVAPIRPHEHLIGALFLLDSSRERSFNDGERDFCWTVALMAGAFLQARDRLENEVRLRTLINNAPVLMFALDGAGTITLFEGKVLETLEVRPQEFVGHSIYEVCGDPRRTRADLETTLAGTPFTGTLRIRGIAFETQYLPLRDLDDQISGVIGVATAVIE